MHVQTCARLIKVYLLNGELSPKLPSFLHNLSSWLYLCVFFLVLLQDCLLYIQRRPNVCELHGYACCVLLLNGTFELFRRTFSAYYTKMPSCYVHMDAGYQFLYNFSNDRQPRYTSPFKNKSKQGYITAKRR